MVTVKIDGGLGNQLFQYAFGLYLKKTYKIDFRMDVYEYLSNTYRKNALRNFNLSNVNFIFERDNKLFEILGRPLHRFFLATKKHSTIRQFSFDEFIRYESISNDSYFVGFWQNWRYVLPNREQLKVELTLRTRSRSYKTLEEYFKVNNVSTLHVRKGDYSLYGMSLPLSYYFSCIKQIEAEVPDTIFLVFSDDIEWCKSNFIGEKYKFVSDFGEFSDCEEMLLISKGQNIVIANSTFSWWSAFLSDSLNVYCPVYMQWGDNYYLENWKKVNVL